MYVRKSSGPSTVPWGTPDKISFSDDISPSSNTFCFLLLRNDWIHLAVLPLTP